jgi:hypothetical protein
VAEAAASACRAWEEVVSSEVEDKSMASGVSFESFLFAGDLRGTQGSLQEP